MSEDLYHRRLEILKFIAGRRQEEPPSVAEVAGSVGLRSTQTAHHHLVKLESDGYLERPSSPSTKPERKRRPVRLTEKGWEAVGEETPRVGRAAAGPGIEAIADGGATSLAADLLVSRSGRRRFTIEVQGDSMTGARIEEGDVLLVEENENPPDGTVVLALLRGEDVTVKRLYRDGDRVRLRYHNGESREIVLPAEEVRVQGEVLRVIHPPGSL